MGKRVLFFVTALFFSWVFLAMSIAISFSLVSLGAIWTGWRASLTQALTMWFVVYGLPLWLLQARFVPNAQVTARVTLYIGFPIIIVLLLAPFEPLKAFCLLGFVTMEPFYRLVDRWSLRTSQ